MAEEYGTLEELSREEFVRKQARLVLEKAASESQPHRFVPEPGKNVCRVCGESFKEGNHLPMSGGR